MCCERVPRRTTRGKLLEPLHGTRLGPIDQQKAQDLGKRASTILQDGELQGLLTTKRDLPESDRARQMFVNRNLKLANIDLIGFDMDYTLAIYHQRRIEQLSYDMTLQRLIEAYQYPRDIAKIVYDHQFVMRGLFVDKRHGNLLKIDRFGHVGRAYHGRDALPEPQMKQLYRNELVRLKNPEYAWIDTLFALPEACLFAGIIDMLEKQQGQKLDYAKLYDDIREAIDTVHRDNSLKTEIKKDIGRYIYKDPELGPALHKLRSGGKKLFLLTNSGWDYTEAVMKYLLDGMVPEYPFWRNYFDVVVTAARKPDFFTGLEPFLEVDPATSQVRAAGEPTALERGKVYQGGNLQAFERLTQHAGERVLYVGDHIYGDILKSKKTSLWRTCMVVQELEDELNYTFGRSEEITRLSELELLRARVDDEIGKHKAMLNSVERKLEREPLDEVAKTALDDERKRLKGELDRLRKAYRETNELAEVLEADVETGFNPFWGLMFKEGNENSRFGEQVEQYACLYTSRVSNFLFYSPAQYFRSPRDLMPHEKAGAPTAKLALLGGEGPPKGTNQA
ncbi:MAG: HAD-IG family 5'-nucleotidase [Myxococcaceae bacterium]|nr:HAD-IG family 5'-nucleotidase [Myxococcaceae bacterium]